MLVEASNDDFVFLVAIFVSKVLVQLVDCHWLVSEGCDRSRASGIVSSELSVRRGVVIVELATKADLNVRNVQQFLGGRDFVFVTVSGMKADGEPSHWLEPWLLHLHYV